MHSEMAVILVIGLQLSECGVGFSSLKALEGSSCTARLYEADCVCGELATGRVLKSVYSDCNSNDHASSINHQVAYFMQGIPKAL